MALKQFVVSEIFCIFSAISLPRAFKVEVRRRDCVISPFQMFFRLFEISGHVCPFENSTLTEEQC